jgi:predicted AlkP superfamily phosphohydrolase/phosphomutase
MAGAAAAGTPGRPLGPPERFPHRDPLVRNDRQLASREAFALPQNTCGAIRVNLSSREPNGRVSSENYDEYCTELSNELLELVNVGTWRPVVQRVIKSADIFIGARLDGLPDLIVEWDASEPITEVTSPRIGTAKGDNPDHRTGRPPAHRPVSRDRAGHPAGLHGPPIQSTDIAPTIASLFGARLPASDGRVFSLVTGPTVAPRG